MSAYSDITEAAAFNGWSIYHSSMPGNVVFDREGERVNLWFTKAGNVDCGRHTVFNLGSESLDPGARAKVRNETALAWFIPR